jgi:cobalt-zinc-cadmium efflux system outer membrane protein
MNTSKLWLVLAVLALASVASGQERLSLRQAIDAALRTHPQLAAGSARTLAAEQLRRQAALLPNPRFIFQMENIRSGFDPGHDADTFAYVSQLIELPGRRSARIGGAAAGAERAASEARLLQVQLVQQIKNAYWTAAAAQRVHELLRQNLDSFQQVLEYHEHRFREGMIAESDLLRVRVESERLQVAVVQAEVTMTRSAIELLRAMGRTDFSAVLLTDPLEPSGTEVISADTTSALETRPDIQAFRAALDRAQSELQLQRALGRPDFDVFGGVKRTGGLNTAVVALQFNVPLFNRNQGNVSAMEAEVSAARADLNFVEARVRAELEAAQAEYDIRRRVTNELRNLREHAVDSAAIALAAYQEGGIDLLRLLDSQRVRIESEILYVTSLSEYQRSVANLEAAMGALR